MKRRGTTLLSSALAFLALALSGCSNGTPDGGSDGGAEAGRDAGVDATADSGLFPGQCATSADCTGSGGIGTYCAGGVCGCVSDLDCPDPTAAHCNRIEQGQCVACTGNADCNGSLGGPICNAGRCTACTSSTDCAQSDYGPICNTATGACGCNAATDCAGVRTGPSCITIHEGGTSAQICGCSSSSDTCSLNGQGAVCQNVSDRWGHTDYICR